MSSGPRQLLEAKGASGVSVTESLAGCGRVLGSVKPSDLDEPNSSPLLFWLRSATYIISPFPLPHVFPVDPASLPSMIHSLKGQGSQ